MANDLAVITDPVDTTPPVPVPVTPQPTEFRNEFEVGDMLKTSGQVALTDREKGILYAPVNRDDVEIRPDGLIYLPWMEYVTRLREAFGMEWSIIPQGMPKIKGTMIMWGFWLIVKGSLMGYAIGEQEYHPENRTMSYTDACEGAKSNALMRLCKGIGISLELWKPSFIREWKLKYAQTYKDGNKIRWKKKDIATTKSSTEAPVPEAPPETSSFDVEVKELFHKLMSFYNSNTTALKEVLESQTKKTSFKEIDENDLKTLKENFEKFEARIKTECSGDNTENKCGHCAIHYDSSYNWCSFDTENTEDDFICPFNLLKKGE